MIFCIVYLKLNIIHKIWQLITTIREMECKNKIILMYVQFLVYWKNQLIYAIILITIHTKTHCELDLKKIMNLFNCDIHSSN